MKKVLFFSFLLLVSSSFNIVSAEQIMGVLKCTDSDGGDRPNTKGTVSIKDSANGYYKTFQDRCVNDKVLLESYCIKRSREPTNIRAEMIEYNNSNPRAGSGILFLSQGSECDFACSGGECVDIQKYKENEVVEVQERNEKSFITYCGKISVEKDKNVKVSTSNDDLLRIYSVKGDENKARLTGDTKKVKVQEGQNYPSETTFFTGADSEIVMRASRPYFHDIVIRPNSVVEISTTNGSMVVRGGVVEMLGVLGGYMKMDCGGPRFRIDSVGFESNIKISTPEISVIPKGTDFSVRYDESKEITTVKLYDQSIEIENFATNKKEVISAMYGTDSVSYEIDKNGEIKRMIGEIRKEAIPAGDDSNFEFSNEEIWDLTEKEGVKDIMRVKSSEPIYLSDKGDEGENVGRWAYWLMWLSFVFGAVIVGMVFRVIIKDFKDEKNKRELTINNGLMEKNDNNIEK